VDADFGGLAFGEVKVGTAEFDELMEVFVDDRHGAMTGKRV